MKNLIKFFILTICALSPAGVFGQTNSSCGSCPVITNAFFYGSVGDASGSDNFNIPATGFPQAYNIVALSVISDPGNNWNSSGNYWTVPTSGTYQIVVKLRLADYSDVGAQCEIGAGNPSSFGDTPNGLWFTVVSGNSGYNRTSASDTIIAHFNSGDHIGMYADPDDNGNDMGGCNASMTINLLFSNE